MAKHHLLSNFERTQRMLIKEAARRTSPPRFYVLAGLGFLNIISLLPATLYVPFLGFFVAILTMVVLFRYFLLMRSIKVVGAWASGVLVGCLLLTGLLSLHAVRVESILYILLGFSMAGALSSLIGSCGLIVWQYEQTRTESARLV